MRRKQKVTTPRGPKRSHHTVEVDNRFSINGSGTAVYGFPTREAALKFAHNHHAEHPGEYVCARESETGRTVYLKRRETAGLRRKVSA